MTIIALSIKGFGRIVGNGQVLYHCHPVITVRKVAIDTFRVPFFRGRKNNVRVLVQFVIGRRMHTYIRKARDNIERKNVAIKCLDALITAYQNATIIYFVAIVLNLGAGMDSAPSSDVCILI